MKLHRLLLFCLLAHSFTTCVHSQTVSKPTVVVVRSGTLKLRALLWQPSGRGPFPGVLFSPGSGQSPPPHSLGRLFANHGYVFLALFRRGQGLSENQGAESARLVMRERAEHGEDAANRLQMQLLEGEELDGELSAVGVLRSLPKVDRNRIALVGHSFGGSLSMLLAERDPSIRALVNFGGGAGSWVRSSYLRERLISAARKLTTPVFYVLAANDYSTAPGEVLISELSRSGKSHRLKVYPAFGKTTGEGHSLIYLSESTWERDVFTFLDAHTSP